MTQSAMRRGAASATVFRVCRWMPLLPVWSVLPVLWAPLGCTAPGGPRSAVEADAAQRVIDAPPEAVRAQGAVILRREFGRLAVDSKQRLETAPQEYITETDSGAARDLYRGRSRMRQSATLTVARGGDAASVARLRVVIEREDSSRERAMAQPTGRLGDAPGAQTAIEQDAATSARQNTVWTRVRRNHALERRLLEELSEHFARAAYAGPESPAYAPVATPAQHEAELAPLSAPAAARPPVEDVEDDVGPDDLAPSPDDQTLVVPAREVP